MKWACTIIILLLSACSPTDAEHVGPCSDVVFASLKIADIPSWVMSARVPTDASIYFSVAMKDNTSWRIGSVDRDKRFVGIAFCSSCSEAQLWDYTADGDYKWDGANGYLGSVEGTLLFAMLDKANPEDVKATACQPGVQPPR